VLNGERGATSLKRINVGYFTRENAIKILSPINAIPIATPPPYIDII
jgi:hypothetical protein